jgi:tripartite-type tricarboxylate transporter receptor subunit TctC
MVNRLYEAVLPMTKDPALIARLREMGVEMAPRTGAELRVEIQRERAYFGSLAREAGLKPQDG